MALLQPFSKRQPRLDWIQVEVTTGCDGACIYCPRSACPESWHKQDMSMSTFRALVPAFSRTSLVFLQGWGEPLLHPELFPMARSARQAGARVGTTTNANRLTPEVAKELVREGFSVLGLSLAGNTQEKNDRVRLGTSLEAVRQGIANLRRAQKRWKTPFPSVHIAYMLLASQLDELEEMPEFFASLGADQVVINSLSLAPTPELEAEATLAESSRQWSELCSRMQEVLDRTAGKGLQAHCRLISPLREPSPCEENIGRALVVGSDGEIFPCVMCSVPVGKEAGHYFLGQRFALPRARFGELGQKNLGQIWREREYKRLRRTFQSGRLPEMCRSCPKSRTVALEPERGHPAAGLVPDL